MTRGESLKDTNLKSAVCAMVERLDDGVRRLEKASEQSADGSSELELVRQARHGIMEYHGSIAAKKKWQERNNNK